jgi:IMP dehydrogenase
MKKCYTYDDINIIPKYSEIEHRDKINISTRFTKKTLLDIPIISSPMDTITGLDMAREMMNWGGVGVIHRFMSIEEQAELMNKLCYMPGSEHVILKNDLPRCAAIGVKDDYLERSQELFNNGCNVLLIDVAHGYHKLVGEAIEEIKTRLEQIEVIAGSVATGEATKYLCEKGADAIRVGIGNGSLCETRIRTGVGIPQVSALLECVAIADTYSVPVIADGGIRNVGDVCKGLACGADTIMLGSLLSGTKESPGEIEKVGKWPNEQLYKKYRGSASLDSKKSRGDKKNVEGNHKVIPYKGKVKRIINDIREGLRSSFSYVGANNLSEFHSKVELIQVTRAGNIEGQPHLL